MTPVRGIAELKVCSGTTLDATQSLQTLQFDEWQVKGRSAAPAKVKEKLAARKVEAAEANR